MLQCGRGICTRALGGRKMSRECCANRRTGRLAESTHRLLIIWLSLSACATCRVFEERCRRRWRKTFRALVCSARRSNSSQCAPIQRMTDCTASCSAGDAVGLPNPFGHNHVRVISESRHSRPSAVGLKPRRFRSYALQVDRRIERKWA